MESYLHPYYSVYHFRLAYSGVIKPLPDKSQWPHVDLGFKVLPPLSKREVGRQRKNRYPSCLEDKGNKPRGKGAWQVQCKNCFQFGHRTTSPKCPLNGTKKRYAWAVIFSCIFSVLKFWNFYKFNTIIGRAVLKKGRLGGHLVVARKVQVHQKGFRSKNVHSAQHKDGATISTPQEGATVSTPQEGATAPTERYFMPWI